eukprot:TRINITY_DN4638_c0_g1_i1.p1 TRINITY_DN4638_c0_g1~~TRINITY_DN4638_c0_g1_i1.p1  ORF type:complete len:425 (+),score=61.67 TRINITY_DN4638_c0_g1_i1:61-1275(+)
MAGGPARVLAISCGASHSVALLSGDLVCSWGRSEDGQLGHGDAQERHVPYIVDALHGSEISQIVCGADHTIAYSSAKKTVYSWGWGDFGRLGHGNSSDLFIPMPIQALTGLSIKQLACGDCHCLAVTEDGGVFSWGRNQNGQLGLGDTVDGLFPQKIPAFEGIKVRMVAAGAEHTAAITEDGRLYGWGWGHYGNLGLGDRLDRKLPELVTSVQGERMAMVACGWRHTIAATASGKVYTVGWSKYGQLGHGDNNDHLVPHAVESLKNMTAAQIAGGWRHSVALMSDGVLYAWGWNKFGQLGVCNNEDQNAPHAVASIPEAVLQVSCGWRHTVAVTEKGNVYAWGRGTTGQLGHGDAADRNTPKLLESLSADGLACTQIPRTRRPHSASTRIPPSERYAVVPDAQW